MRTGKLAISRGQQGAEAPHLSLVPASPIVQPAPASPDYEAVHDRLTSLERLLRLHEQGALSVEEFQAEKTVILGLPVDELVLHDPAPLHFVPARKRGPSLLGRVIGWKFLLLSLAAGFGLSYASQPEQTIRFFEQIGRYLA